MFRGPPSQRRGPDARVPGEGLRKVGRRRGSSSAPRPPALALPAPASSERRDECFLRRRAGGALLLLLRRGGGRSFGEQRENPDEPVDLGRGRQRPREEAPPRLLPLLLRLSLVLSAVVAFRRHCRRVRGPGGARGRAAPPRREHLRPHSVGALGVVRVGGLL